jgi:ATP-dependent protease HslVU (ClpYQ) peptidase subunit
VTCVLAIEDGDGVVLASDAFLGGADTRDLVARPKTFRRPGLAIGWAGDAAAAQAVEHMPRFRARRRGEDPEAYLVTVVVARVRTALARLGYPRDGRDSVASPAEFIIAVGSAAFVLQSDLSAVRSAFGFCAIGAGAPYALGALAATSGTPEVRARRALEVAAQLCPLVAPPFAIVRVGSATP